MKKVNIKDNSIGIKDKETREKTVGLLAMWKEFWNSESKEMSETEEIMQSEEVSEEIKKVLIKSLKDADCIVKPTDGGSYKTTKLGLREDAKKSAEKALKENPINLDTNRNIDAKNGKIIKNKIQIERAQEDDVLSK